MSILTAASSDSYKLFFFKKKNSFFFLHNCYAEMSSDFSSNLSPKPTATSGTLQNRLIRIVKAQTSLLVTDLNINNFIERSTEINTVSDPMSLLLCAP